MKSDRLLALLLALQQAGKQSATALAEQLEVSVRTIYRDVDALSAAGVPVYAERGSHGGIVLADSYRDTLARFDENEVRALFVSSDDALADIGLHGGHRSALDKLARAMPARTRETARRRRAAACTSMPAVGSACRRRRRRSRRCAKRCGTTAA